MIEQVFLGSAAVGAAATLVTIVGAGIYDLRQTQAERLFRCHPYAKPYRQRPLVSIVVSTHNNLTTIRSALQSIRLGSYRKVEVIVIDHSSDDGTASLIRKYQKQYPKLSLRLVVRRNSAGQTQALSSNIKKYARGELIMTIDGRSWLDKQALSQAVRLFSSDPAVVSVNLRLQAATRYSTVGLLQRYHELFAARSRKALSLLPNAPAEPLKPLMRRQAVNHGRSVYLHSAVVNSHPLSVPQFLQHAFRYYRLGAVTQRSLFLPLTFINLLLAITLPAFVTYFFYLAVALREPDFFLLSLGVIVGLILMSVWDETQLGTLRKLAYSLMLPIALPLFYLLIFIRIGAVSSVILRPKPR